MYVCILGCTKVLPTLAQDVDYMYVGKLLKIGNWKKVFVEYGLCDF